MAEQFEKSWQTLNKDLDRISALEQATAYTARPLVAAGGGAGLHGACRDHGRRADRV